MEFGFSEEQQELATTVRGLLTKRADPRAVRAAMTSDLGHDAELWQTLVDQIGATALAIPEQHGGAGFSLFEAVIVLEELGRSLAPTPLLASLVTAEALLAGADPDAQARLLPRIAAGEVAAYADGDTPALDAASASVLVGVVGDVRHNGLDSDPPDVSCGSFLQVGGQPGSSCGRAWTRWRSPPRCARRSTRSTPSSRSSVSPPWSRPAPTRSRPGG